MLFPFEKYITPSSKEFKLNLDKPYLYVFNISCFLQFLCGKKKTVTDVERSELFGYTVLCGLPTDTEITCSAAAINSVGVGTPYQKSVYPQIEGKNELECSLNTTNPLTLASLDWFLLSEPTRNFGTPQIGSMTFCAKKIGSKRGSH